MTRLEKVIELVKESRKSENRPWIYNEDGTLNENIILIDTLNVLEALKDYEISVSDRFIEYFKETSYNYYTYNSSANVTNDITFFYKKSCPVIVINIHLGGDARIIWDTDFVIKMENSENDMLFVLMTFLYDIGVNLISIGINEKYCASNVSMFSDTYEVYNRETDEIIGSFYEIEKNELLKMLEKQEGKANGENNGCYI